MKTILNVAYSFDDNYAQYAGISLFSLLDNNQDIDEINVYIIDNHIKEINRQKIKELVSKYKRKVIYLDLFELTSELQVSTNFNRSAYGRLFLSKLTNLDSILYFDSDTVITASLRSLVNIEMSNTLVAGVQDTVNPFFVSGIGLTYKHRYINDGGVIVLNLKLWRELNVSRKCIDFILGYNGNPPHNDQGTINSVCQNYIKILSANYNMMNPMFMFPVDKIKRLFRMKTYYTQQEIDNAISHPVVIHYTAELYNRPWFSNCNHPLKQVYIDYLNKSPWKSELKYKAMSMNCKIQKWVYDNCPFLIYELMIRFIYIRHKWTHRVM